MMSINLKFNHELNYYLFLPPPVQPGRFEEKCAGHAEGGSLWSWATLSASELSWTQTGLGFWEKHSKFSSSNIFTTTILDCGNPSK